MVLTSPLMLLGLLALPALAAIYWLRSRSRRVVVSSLILWIDQRRARKGGLILQRMQAPLSFFLELLAIAMLVAAAAGPALLKTEIVRPLVVVLDDSYSMLARGSAGGQDSPRARAAAAVQDELGRGRYVARVILAGAEPRLLGDPLRTPDQAGDVLVQWTCQSPWADLARAMAVAVEVGGPAARILVLSDHAPVMTLDSGQVEWWAFGAKLPNMAFTAATRTPFGDGERVLLEVANLSDSPGQTSLLLEGGNLASPRPSAVQLAGGAVRQFFLNLPARSPPLRATLGDDALEIDNHVWLLPESTKPVRVLVNLADASLRQVVLRAVEAAGQATEVSERPELTVCDTPGGPETDAWRLEILGGKDTVAYAGPFVVDHNHPLAEGLSLQSAIWSGAPQTTLSGLPVVTAGNVTLMTDREDVAGRHHLQMRFVADLSNLQDMPDWPILFANLLRWRRAGLPGVAAPNVRLGQTAAVTLAEEVRQVELTAAGGSPRKIEVHGRRVGVPADRVGLLTLKARDVEYQFSCNAVSRDESDLSDCRSGRWGNWNRSEVYQDRQASLSWIFLLVAAAAMTANLAVVAARSENKEIAAAGG